MRRPAAAHIMASRRCMRFGAVVGLLFVHATVSAQTEAGDDFGRANAGWNGLTSLEMMLVSGGEALPAGDSSVQTSTVLWMIQPQDLQADELYDWVASGGRVLLADETGAADEFLTMLGLAPSEAGWQHTEFLQGERGLPILRAAGVHPLSTQAANLVANQPRAVNGTGRAVYEFEEGGGLVWDVSLGRGRVVVVSDPSIFINLMLPIGDNARFVTNVMTHLCPQEPCSYMLTAGEPAPELVSGEVLGQSPSAFRTTLAEVAETLTRINIEPRLLVLANLLLALGAAVVLWTMFPRLVRPWLSALPRHWPRAMRSSIDQELSRYTGELAETSFVRPAAQLAQTFVPVYDAGAARWGVPVVGSVDSELTPRALAQAWVRRMEGTTSGFRVSRRIRELEWMFDILRRLPKGPSMPVQTGTLSRDDFMRLYDLCREVLEKMEMHGELDRAGSP